MYHISNIMYIMYVQEREREKKTGGAWTFARFASLPRCFVDFWLIFGPGRYCSKEPKHVTSSDHIDT